MFDLKTCDTCAEKKLCDLGAPPKDCPQKTFIYTMGSVVECDHED